MSWFTGEAAQEDGFMLGDDEDEDEDEEDDDDDVDDDEDDEDEDEDDDDDEDEEPKNVVKKVCRTLLAGLVIFISLILIKLF